LIRPASTAACYVGSCAAVWLVLLMSRRNLPRPIEWKKVPQHLLHETRRII